MSKLQNYEGNAYEKKRILKLEENIKQLRIGRRVLMDLLEKCLDEKTLLEKELSNSDCFNCGYRRNHFLKQRKLHQ